MTVKLCVNVDHIATVRQARGGIEPDPIDGARICEEAGAYGITVHLREDRRHILDSDVKTLKETVKGKLNLEMALSDEIIDLALSIIPNQVTLVPEKREEEFFTGAKSAVFVPIKASSSTTKTPKR